MIDRFKYFRDQYGVPAYKGVRVWLDGKPGVIVGSDGPHLRLRLDGEKRTVCAHPTWMMEYEWVAYQRAETLRMRGATT